jgi:hypothetical protein
VPASFIKGFFRIDLACSRALDVSGGAAHGLTKP